MDELIVMVAPVLCEDSDGKTLVEPQSRLTREAARLRLVDAETLAGGVIVPTSSVGHRTASGLPPLRQDRGATSRETGLAPTTVSP